MRVVGVLVERSRISLQARVLGTKHDDLAKAVASDAGMSCKTRHIQSDDSLVLLIQVRERRRSQLVRRADALGQMIADGEVAKARPDICVGTGESGLWELEVHFAWLQKEEPRLCR